MKKKVDDLINKIHKEIEAGNQEDAIELCEKAISMDSNCIEARLILSELAMDGEDYDTAIEMAKEVLEIDAENETAYLLLAEISLNVQEFEDTLAICSHLIDNHPDCMPARFFLAEALVELGSPFEAIPYYREFLKEYPSDLTAMIALAVALYETAAFKESIELFNDIIKLDDTIADAYYFKGLIEYRFGNKEVAESLFNKATKLDPESYPTELKLSQEEFHDIVTDAISQTPPSIQQYFKKVRLSYRDIPSDEDLKPRSGEPSISPNLWGMIKGEQLSTPISDPLTHLPHEIVFYKANLQRSANDKLELAFSLSNLLLHELIHFLNLSEDQMKEFGIPLDIHSSCSNEHGDNHDFDDEDEDEDEDDELLN